MQISNIDVTDKALKVKRTSSLYSSLKLAVVNLMESITVACFENCAKVSDSYEEPSSATRRTTDGLISTES